jgi:hypothetical protein
VPRGSLPLLLALLLTSLICAIAVCASPSAVPLASAFTIGPERAIAHRPVVNYNPDLCEYLVVWSSTADETSGADIWAQRISWEGDAQGEPIAVCSAVGDQLLPSVAYCPLSHEYLVIWQDQRTAEGSGVDVYARRVGSAGELIAAELSITAAGGDQLRPRIAYNPVAEQYLIVWQDSEAGNGESDIFGRWLVADGGWAGDEFAVCDASGGQSVPELAADQSRARCLVVWEDSRHASWKHQDIYGRFITPGNREDGQEIRIANAPSPEYSPRIAYNAVIDEYLVVWEDEIGGQRLSGEGEPIGSAFSLFRACPYLRKPALAVDTDSADWVMVWEGRCDEGGLHLDVYGRRFSADAGSGDTDFVLCDQESNQLSPAISYNTQRGESLAVWIDDLGGDGSLVVRGRRFMFAP